MKTDTTTMIAAMYELARTMRSDDGVANAEILEAAERLELQHAYIDLIAHHIADCSPYLKCGESPADRIRRCMRDNELLMRMLADEKMKCERITAVIEKDGYAELCTAERDAVIADAVAAERSRCISAVNDERVNSVSEEDVAYNLALDHACAAIQSVDKQ